MRLNKPYTNAQYATFINNCNVNKQIVVDKGNYILGIIYINDKGFVDPNGGVECESITCPNTETHKYVDGAWVEDEAKKIEFENKRIDQERISQYGSFGSQLDEIFHDVEAWKTRIQQVKNDNPKLIGG